MNATCDFNIAFPQIDSIPQGQEYFILEREGVKEKIVFHDYDKIYEIPGLYEYLFYERYKCKSPETVCSLLHEQIKQEKTQEIEKIQALDIGAGNGMVGEQLAGIGAESIVGIDIIDEAAEALQRDRPGIYDAYHVADLTCLSPDVEASLTRCDFNCMTVVAALGFGDIPPEAFACGYNLVSEKAWVAFNIKEDFIKKEDQSGFRKLIDAMDAQGIMDIRDKKRYRHRFCQDGTPLYYYAVVGKKVCDIPGELVRAVS